MKTSLKLVAITAPLLLGACMSMPTGPSVMALPGSSKTFDQFRADDMDCRQYAHYSIGGKDAAAAQTESAVNSAVIGTAVGALAGAAIGGHNGAAVGAGTGLLVGAAAGSGAANASGYSAGRRYDQAYVQCMYAKGHKVPTEVPVRTAERRHYSPPAYRYPPPPPPGYYPPPGY